MKNIQLLAKSLSRENRASGMVPYSATLRGHTEQCIDIAEFFNEQASTYMVKACGTSDEHYLDWFQRSLLIVAAVHDIGKSSVDFQQRLITKSILQPHLVRHEVLSYWMITQDAELRRVIGDYLGSSGIDHLSIYVHSAVLGHHLKFPRGNGDFRYLEEPLQVESQRLNESQLNNLLSCVLKQKVEFTQLESIPGRQKWYRDAVVKPFRHQLSLAKSSPLEQRLGSMLRGALIAVDTIGSLQFNTREDWLKCLGLLRDSWYARDSLSEKLQADISRKVSVSDSLINAFQDEVVSSTADVVLVEAGCGLGKTISAYKRASKLLSRGITLGFPTTSVASQLFEDYVDSSDSQSQLLHGRSEVDMSLMELNLADETEPDVSGKVQPKEETIEAIRRLLSPVTFCTVDTVLGVLQMRRSSLCLLPVLCQSAIVFDEVHAYSPRLFGHLLAFVQNFHMPTMLMTATLPPNYREALEKTLANKSLALVPGPEVLEKQKRYRIEIGQESNESSLLNDEILTRIRGNFIGGKKVLVVANQVGWASAIYEQLKSQPGLEQSVKLLHSHFKYGDRRRHQSDIIARFKQDDGFIAVTTQICEISFDISADLLVSHIAPFDAMVQRLGRLNRGAWVKDGVRDALFFKPPSSLPYKEKEMETGTLFASFVKEKGSVEYSQLDLRNWLNYQSTIQVVEPVDNLTWFEHQWADLGDPLREAGYTISVLTKADFKNHQDVVGRLKCTMPMPNDERKHGNASKMWRSYYIVLDEDVDYDYETGGRWINV